MHRLMAWLGSSPSCACMHCGVCACMLCLCVYCLTSSLILPHRNGDGGRPCMLTPIIPCPNHFSIPRIHLLIDLEPPFRPSVPPSLRSNFAWKVGVHASLM